MDLYTKELAKAKELVSKYNYDIDQFVFDMAYETPDPDAAGMFTVSYIVTVSHTITGIRFTAVGGIGLDWLDGFEEALANRHFH